MTDNAIPQELAALREYARGREEEWMWNELPCKEMMALIERQAAEIERLNKVNDFLEKERDVL